VLTFVDITARRQAEQSLNEKQRQLAEELRMFSALYDLTTRILGGGDLATAMQDILGAQHDASRACEWLLGLGSDDPNVTRSAGWLAAGAASERDALRDAWWPAWRALGRPKARFW